MKMVNRKDFDLWEGIDDGLYIEPEVIPESDKILDDEIPSEKSIPDLTIPEGMKGSVVSVEDKVFVNVPRVFLSSPAFESLISPVIHDSGDRVVLELYINKINAFVLRYFLPKKTYMPDETREILSEKASSMNHPRATVSKDGRQIVVDIPPVLAYREILTKLGSKPHVDGSYRIPMVKAIDFESISQNMKPFPNFRLDKSVLSLSREPIPGFDGSIESLKNINPDVLNVVKANSQSWKNLKKSKMTLSEKLEKFGIENLYDLLFWLPKRYIDKTQPQEISDLIEGETATITGKVKNIFTLPGDKGIKFTVKTEGGESIPVMFWRQTWLKSKFPEGSNVTITGKCSFFNRQKQLSGSSIDHSEEAALLPIVPVYKQSESKGITTNFLLSANRELISRIGDVSLPDFLSKPGRDLYSDTLNELHFPTSIDLHNSAVNDLAYYELIMMQLIILNSKRDGENTLGISQPPGEVELQRMGIEGFPFELTEDQKKAVKILNESLASEDATQTLLNSDVGSGKTLITQLACLRTVETGRQAIFVGPTDVLSRQIYSTLEKLVEPINRDKELVRIGFFDNLMSAAEKREFKKKVKEGELDIIVGGHSLIMPSFVYKDLALVCVDEQQKFGASQRSEALKKRNDGRQPDLLMLSATPIPRSTAQVFYGEMNMIELKGKPKGRKDIETEWIEEDPQDVIDSVIHPVWQDVLQESEKGNQTFVITPMVSESDKIDAASVERTYKSLTAILGKDNVAIVHGQMKKEEQKEQMDSFRNKEKTILVASSVVEVGVDIPDATRVVILSADRFGASSLHQIRGRVGRSNKESKCYLVSLGKTKSAQIRLSAMVEHSDGFSIAKADLELRGEGQIFGSTQSGASDMIFANLSKHSERIPEAIEEAKDILSDERMKNDALTYANDYFSRSDEERLF